MSTTRGVRTLVGVALASTVILLGGCSSSGSTGGKSPLAGGSTTTSAAGSDKSSSPASGGDSSSSPSGDSSSSSSDGSSGGSSGGSGGEDAGCKAAEDAAQSAMSSMNVSDPAGAKKALQDVAKKMHDAAGKAQKPGAAAAINKLGDDYNSLATAISTGKLPDTSAIMNDATAMTTACVG